MLIARRSILIEVPLIKTLPARIFLKSTSLFLILPNCDTLMHKDHILHKPKENTICYFLLLQTY